MRLTLLITHPSGRKEFEECRIRGFYWKEHKFFYEKIINGDIPERVWRTLNDNEEIIGLELWNITYTL